MWLRQKNPLQAQPRTKINMRMHIRFINIGPNSNNSIQFITSLHSLIPWRYWKTGRTLLPTTFKKFSGQMLRYVIFTNFYRYLIKYFLSMYIFCYLIWGCIFADTSWYSWCCYGNTGRRWCDFEYIEHQLHLYNGMNLYHIPIYIRTYQKTLIHLGTHVLN